MSENKHTPGPWSVGNPPDGTRGYVYCGDVTGSAVAQVKFSQVHRTEQETDANARLIAAAPEMLDVLLGVAENTVSLEWRAKVHAVIAKATGR